MRFVRQVEVFGEVGEEIDGNEFEQFPHNARFWRKSKLIKLNFRLRFSLFCQFQKVNSRDLCVSLCCS